MRLISTAPGLRCLYPSHFSFFLSLCYYVYVINHEFSVSTSFSVSSAIDDVACDIGRGDEESPGEEYEAGEYVLEDLELGSPEKAGKLFIFIFIFFCSMSSVFWLLASCD
jgi:hypothetical protein